MDIFDTISTTADVNPSTDKSDIFDTLERSETSSTDITPKIKSSVSYSPIMDELFGATVKETKQAQDLVSRFGKQFYNAFAAAPAQAIGTESPIALAKTDARALEILQEDVKQRYEAGEPLTIQEIQYYTKPYKKWSLGNLLKFEKPQWQQKLAIDYKAGKVRIADRTKEEEINKLTDVISTARQEISEGISIAAPVRPPETVVEKGIDAAAGIAGFVAQLAVLRKAMPQAPEAVLWETQNIMSGGTPGHGALTYGLFSLPGKVIPGKTIIRETERLAAESGLLAGLTAIEGGTKEDILISAGIPFGFKALKIPGLIKNLKAKNPQLATTLSVQPDFFSIETKSQKAVPVMLNEITWNKRWGGDNVANLKLKINQLLFQAHKVEQKNLPNKDVVLNNLANQMDIIHKRLLKLRDLKTKNNKTLLKLAKQNGIKLPKGANRETIIELLKGHQDIVPVEDGFIVRDVVNPENQWKPERYKTIEEAKKSLFNQEVNLTVPTEGIGAVVIAATKNKIGIDKPWFIEGKSDYENFAKTYVNQDKTWTYNTIKNEIDSLASQINTTPEFIVGNIQLQEVIKKVSSRFPIKITDQKSLKVFGQKFLDYVGMGDWGIKFKLVKSIPKKYDPSGTATGYAALNNPEDLTPGKRGGIIYIKKPTGEVFSTLGWIPTPGQAGHVERKPGETVRHTQGYVKRDIAHEVAHFLEPGAVGKEGQIIVHTPEFVVKAKELSKSLFDIKKEFIPIEEGRLRRAAEPVYPPGTNVYRTVKGRTVVEYPNRPGVTNMIEGKVYDITTGEELVLDRNLSPSGKISRYSIPPTDEPIKKKIGIRKPTTKVKGKSAIQVIKNWEIKEWKMAKSEWETIKHKERQKRNAAALNYREHLIKDLKYPKSEANRMMSDKFGGKFRKPQIKPPELTNAQWEGLSDSVGTFYSRKGYGYSLRSAQEALDKLRNGNILTDAELNYFRPILGNNIVNRLSEGFAKVRTYGRVEKLEIVRDLFKLKFGADIQTPRQLLGIAVRHPIIYFKSIGKTLSAIASKERAKKIANNIEHNPVFKTGQEDYGVNYLWTKPWKKTPTTQLEQFGNVSDAMLKSKNRIIQGIGKVYRRIETGANLGIDSALNDLVSQAEKRADILSRKDKWSQDKLDSWKLSRGKDINAMTRRFIAESRRGKSLQANAKWILISPAWTASRPNLTYRAINNMFRSPGNRTYAAQVMLSQLGMYHAVGILTTAIKAKLFTQDPTKQPQVESSTDPGNSLWGKIRVDNDVYDITAGDGAYYRLLERILLSAAVQVYDLATEKMTTKIPEHKVTVGGVEVFSLGGSVPKPGDEIMRYMTSRETISLGLTRTLLTGKDWLGRDTGAAKAVLESLPVPESLISMLEAGIGDGTFLQMVDDISNDHSKLTEASIRAIPAFLWSAMGMNISTYPVSPYSTRIEFRNFIGQQEYKKDWNELNPSQIKSLERQYKTEFSNFDKLIKEWKIKHPVNIEAIQKEEKDAGEFLRGKLSSTAQAKLSGTSLALSRRPKNFYLSDERLNTYIEYVAEELERLLEKREEPTDKQIKTYKEMAKTRAYYRLKRELE